jgi:hypothetical protein
MVASRSRNETGVIGGSGSAWMAPCGRYIGGKLTKLPLSCYEVLHPWLISLQN